MSFVRQPLILSRRLVNSSTASRTQSLLRSPITTSIPVRQFHYTPRKMSGNDQYSAKAAAEPGLAQKLTDLRAFIKKHKTLMLVTRAPDGALHARVMAPAEITPDWKFRFIYDNTSYKETEFDNE